MGLSFAKNLLLQTVCPAGTKIAPYERNVCSIIYIIQLIKPHRGDLSVLNI